ncbi:MAG: hypothetical protein LBL90_04030 [Prevotellaceae bacterium]|nr:hypothetical protein [Prevotellaceae bacterium]
MLFCFLLQVCLLFLCLGKTKRSIKASYVDSLNRYYQHVDLLVYIYISASFNDANPAALKEINAKGKEIKPIYLHMYRYLLALPIRRQRLYATLCTQLTRECKKSYLSL